MGHCGINYLESLAQWKGQGGFGLDKIRSVCAQLGNPQDAYSTIHVVGTNGKGSVSATLCSIFGASGARVGLNISPHLQYMRERIVVDGLPISDEALGCFADCVRQASGSLGTELSFFEAITATAFVAFREMKVEWAVIEAGLGARFDATNIIKRPKAVVLVSVQHDHEDILGPWPESIATEKCEAFKQGAPVFVGAVDEHSARIAREKAASLAVSMTQLGVEASISPLGNGAWCLERGQISVEFAPSLLGGHQVHNIGLAICVALGLGVSPECCSVGARGVFWPARLETVERQGKRITIDCAHNLEGVQAVANFLRETKQRDLSIIFSALASKDWRCMASELAPFAKNWILLRAQGPRAASCNEIRDFIVHDLGAEVSNFEDDYRAALACALAGDMSGCLICGSMYMVGPMRQLLEIPDVPIWRVAS